MTLGILLSLGDSFSSLGKTGQSSKFLQFYIKQFAQNFEEIYIFSYENENVKGLPKNVHLIPNKYMLNRFVYGFVMPFQNFLVIRECDVFRAYHLSGTIPAIVIKILWDKPFIFNWAYDYFRFAIIERKYLQAFLFKLLGPIATFFATKIFTANKKIFSKFNKSKRIYLPNGVDVDFFKPTSTSKKTSLPVVLSVGRLESQKNFLNLVRAMQNVKAKLLIVGKGSLRSELIKEAKRLKINFEIIERVDNKFMPKIYQSSTLFVLPSLLEGHPKAMLEAMACGRACLGSDVEGIAEILNNQDILTGTESNEIGEKIKYLLSSRVNLKRIGSKLRKRVVKDYNLKKLLVKEIDSLKSLKV